MNMYLLLDLFSLGCGVYCFYTWIRLLVQKELFVNALLVPKEKKPSDCSDEQAYIRFIKPRLAALALATTAYGVVQILNTYFGFLNGLLGLLPLAVVLGVLILYAAESGKANRMFFGM